MDPPPPPQKKRERFDAECKKATMEKSEAYKKCSKGVELKDLGRNIRERGETRREYIGRRSTNG
jgi:hypothetical protein